VYTLKSAHFLCTSTVFYFGLMMAVFCLNVDKNFLSRCGLYVLCFWTVINVTVLLLTAGWLVLKNIFLNVSMWELCACDSLIFSVAEFNSLTILYIKCIAYLKYACKMHFFLLFIH